jgi:tRNA-Thr(GGU) m(6)t(6)A37 methyltransferase TsaA
VAKVKPIGVVESELTEPEEAPMQGRDGAPDAWLVFSEDFFAGLADMRVGDRVVVLTWLDRADRDTLRVRPLDIPNYPKTGVFSTRSADRPNPIGLHEVKVLELGNGRILVNAMEAIDGTPILDLKPAI